MERWIDWVICGGESGLNARPMHPDWARPLRDQCVAADVPFFFKQWGEWVPRSHGFSDEGRFPWGTIGVDGSWYSNTTPWSGHDYDGSGEAVMIRVCKKSAGALLDGLELKQFPEVIR